VAEVLTRFTSTVSTTDGIRYAAQACAAPNTDGLWEGWIEFVPVDGGPALRSPRETTQPNRRDAQYWATGLTAVYLEGALARALNPLVAKLPAPPTEPIFDGPAEAPVHTRSTKSPAVDAVLDPFSVYEKGEALLRQELSALSAYHLVNILLAYELTDQPVAVLNNMTADELAELIVRKVRQLAVTR
jgi:hypothetical protein